MDHSRVAPIDYFPGFIGKRTADLLFDYLWKGLPWIDVTPARRECWMNDFGNEYTYGVGAGRRTYVAQPWDLACLMIRQQMRFDPIGNIDLNACFANAYANERNSLGWHADDSPEIAPKSCIVVISVGAERSIMFRPKDDPDPRLIQQITLEHGSLLFMNPGMQEKWLHKIPKHPEPCGPRASMTYRELIPPQII